MEILFGELMFGRFGWDALQWGVRCSLTFSTVRIPRLWLLHDTHCPVELYFSPFTRVFFSVLGLYLNENEITTTFLSFWCFTFCSLWSLCLFVSKIHSFPLLIIFFRNISSFSKTFSVHLRPWIFLFFGLTQNENYLPLLSSSNCNLNILNI